MRDHIEYYRGVSEPLQTSKMECLERIVYGFKLLIIFAKHTIPDVSQGSKELLTPLKITPLNYSRNN